MGWFHFLRNANNAEGAREAIRLSHAKHRRLAAAQPPSGTSPHKAGLYGALGTRYLTRGQRVPEVVLWAELTPFMLMPEDRAVEALAEYVIYQERSADANVPWLTAVINDALRRAAPSEESPRVMAPVAMINRVSWCALLEPDVHGVIEEEVLRIIAAMEQAGE